MVQVKSIPDIIKDLTGKGPESEHKLVYDSASETMEPVYFFLLDLMNEFGLKTEKLLDNFVSSSGSGHFGEMGQRVSIMQQQGSKLLGDINAVLRSVLNLIYDLREFKTRLQSYEDLKDPAKKEGALLSLKQVWMDKVDAQRGNSSIKGMALSQAGFNTLIDAFLVVHEVKDVDKLDLNQIVKRILKPRIHEFNIWVTNSEQELRKRYEIEKTYLKSQVSSLKIYSRWAKPYLKAAQELEMSESGRDANLVKMFNTLILELTLLGKHKIDVKTLAVEEVFPKSFKTLKIKRDYHPCVLVDFNFRSIPQKMQQGGFALGGKVEVIFRAYSLNSDELKKLDQELEASDLNTAMSLIEGSTEESLGQLKEDLDYFLGEDDKEEIKPVKDVSNPFMALFGKYEKKPEKKDKKDEKIDKIEKDTWYEKYFRDEASTSSKETAYGLLDIYKKAHGMASFT
ncbi:hypothetical protein HOD29_06700 [archaeon]|jgi:hypothetical protein|nr:hypothetical protein [archaeon]